MPSVLILVCNTPVVHRIKRYWMIIGNWQPVITSTCPLLRQLYQAYDWATICLKNLVIGYTIPLQIIQKAHIQKLRVYFSGNDLWEKTHIRDGWDPEATRSIGRANNENAITRYPFYRYMTAGINVTF